MNSAPLGRGASEEPDPDPIISAPTTTVVDELIEIAGRLKHAAELALIAAQSEEPERAARYLLDTCAEYREQIHKIAAQCAVAAAVVVLLS